MRARPFLSFGSTASLVLITGLAAVILLGSVSPVAAQPEAAEMVVRDALESASFAMQLEGENYLWFDTQVLEFLPASSVVPGGGFVITRDITDYLIMGAPYELPRWAVWTQDGAVVFSLTYLDEGEPLVTIEGPISRIDSEHLTIDLRGSIQGPDGIEEMIVTGSLVPLEPIPSGSDAHHREELFGQWTLQRVEVLTISEDEQALEPDGRHPITYTFASNGTFAVEAEGGLGTDIHSGLHTEALGGHWIVTGNEWERPPISESRNTASYSFCWVTHPCRMCSWF